MPELSRIDLEKLSTYFGQAESAVDHLNSAVNSIFEAVETLDKGWMSEVKKDFMATYAIDKEAMQEMLAQLREFNQTLRDAAADFDKTEGEILDQVNALH